MKKLVNFLLFILLLLTMFGMVFVASAIYDTTPKITVDTFFFQPADLSSRRIGVPASLNDLSADKIREMLVDKFITEYFYVIPDAKNVQARLDGAIGLRRMVSSDVFNEWAQTVGTEISAMADMHQMRMARMLDMELPIDSDNWWTVTYELTTWEKPNDLSHAPVVTRGTMYIKLAYEPGIRPTMNLEKFDLGKFLEHGGDPSLIFRFRVDDIE